jgi:hypothetical protein
LRRISGGGQIVEACPAYCVLSHVQHQRSDLDDLFHSGAGVAMDVAVFDHWDDGEPVAVAMPILAASVRVDPYSTNPARNVPHVAFEPWEGEVMEGLTPDEFATVIARIRAHCNRLDRVHAQLVAAVAQHVGGAR